MDGQAFLEHFRSMSEIGATAGGGVDRQAATVADGQNRHWFRGVVESHGFEVRYDEVGNQFALLELAPGAPWVAVGSHLDSQPTAGRFDGAYGVLAGAHAAARLAGLEGAKYNIAVINWFNEEGSRFKPSMMGSSVFTGKLAAEAVLETTDPDGVSVREALEGIGTIGDFALEVAAYVEIHVEQGRSLEDSGAQIGLVESTWGAHKYEFTVKGEQAHTGSTMIADRRDAMLGAALLISSARDVADRFTDESGTVVTSCGELYVYPNSPVVVASEVRMLVDIRATGAERLEAAVAAFEERIREAADRARVEIERGAEHSWTAQEYDGRGVELARAAAESLGLSSRVVRTVAGHDSTNMKDVVPTIMLFVPSVEGISHNERELTRDEDMTAGVDLLTEVLRRVVRGEYAYAE
ncbi:Beta-ureidopropionase [Gulosibacter sp. 10]|nr:Beta-ureidopropionase [Gulosibacter sp. 10]